MANPFACSRAASAFFVASMALAGGARSQVTTVPLDELTVHVMNRMAYGGTPATIQSQTTIHHLATWMSLQVLGDAPIPQDLTTAIFWLDPFEPGSEPTMTGAPLEHGWTRLELFRKRLLMATYNPNQLRERMANFWRTLLNTYSPKVYLTYLNLLPMGPNQAAQAEKIVTHLEWVQFEQFRNLGLLTFRQILDASINAAPMRTYLDLHRNVSTAFPNENYARELLELHTMGPEYALTGAANYSQTDIHEISRAFVGLGIKTQPVAELGQILNTDQTSPPGEVKLFTTIPHVTDLTVPSSNKPADKAKLILDHIVKQEACRDYICRRLIRYFVRADADFDDDEMQFALAKAKLRWGSDGDITGVLSEIFVSKPFLETKLRKTIKTPFESEVSQVRRFGGESPPLTAGLLNGLDDQIRRMINMGQWLFYFPSPDGFPISSYSQAGSLRSRIRWESGYRIWERTALVTSGDPHAFVQSLGANMSDPNDIVLTTLDHLFPNDFTTLDKDGALEILGFDPNSGTQSPWPSTQDLRTERLRVMLGYVAGLTQMMIK